jgi:hypothetical protein
MNAFVASPIAFDLAKLRAPIPLTSYLVHPRILTGAEEYFLMRSLNII